MLSTRSTAAQIRGCPFSTLIDRGHRHIGRTRRSPGNLRQLAPKSLPVRPYHSLSAYFDVLEKGRFRNELDIELAEARKSLNSLLENSAADDLVHLVKTAPESARLLSLRNVDQGTDWTAQGVLESICRHSPEFLESHAERVEIRKKKILSRYQELLPKFQTQEWHRLSSDWGSAGLQLCQDVIEQEEIQRTHEDREPMTPVHFDKRVEQIEDLVDNLMHTAYEVTDELTGPESHFRPDSLHSPFQSLRMTRREGFPQFSHPQLFGDAKANEGRMELNRQNRIVFYKWRGMPHRREQHVAELCVNMLTCRVPPGIHEYNVLIAGFAQIGEHKLAQVVVDSLLHNSLFKVTGGSILWLLHHYRLKNDIVGFNEILRRLVGHDVRGMVLHRTDLNRDIERWVMFWALNTPNMPYRKGPLNTEYFVKIPELDQIPHLPETLFECLLHFKLTGQAAKVFVLCLKEKRAVSHELLDNLLQLCLQTFDVVATRAIVGGLIEHLDETSKLILGPHPLDRTIVRKLRAILNVRAAQADTRLVTLINPPHSPKLESPEIEVQEAMIMKRDSQPTAALLMEQREVDRTSYDAREEWALHRIVTAIWIREVSGDLALLNLATRKIQRSLGQVERMSKPVKETTLLMQWASQVMELIDGIKARSRTVFDSAGKVCRYGWLSAGVERAYNKTTSFHHKVMNIIGDTIPRPSRKVSIFDKELTRAERIRKHISLMTPGTITNEIAKCYEVSQALDERLRDIFLEHWTGFPHSDKDAQIQWRVRELEQGAVNYTNLFELMQGHLNIIADREAHAQYSQSYRQTKQEKHQAYMEEQKRKRIELAAAREEKRRKRWEEHCLKKFGRIIDKGGKSRSAMIAEGENISKRPSKSLASGAGAGIAALSGASDDDGVPTAAKKKAASLAG